MATIADINSNLIGKFSGAFTSSGFINSIGWLIFGVFVIGVAGFMAYYYLDKKKFNKKITAFEIIGNMYDPRYHDMAKTVKLGKGGFEVLYLKKMKTWKIAYGGKTTKNNYYFFIDPIGYWYNGVIGAYINYIDEHGGLVPVVTTNPTMRAQYTALEKQIDALHGEKQGFWDKYGSWVLTLTYIVIIGVFSWLSYREIGQFLGSGSELARQMTALAETMNRLAVNLNGAGGSSGLVPA